MFFLKRAMFAVYLCLCTHMHGHVNICVCACVSCLCLRLLSSHFTASHQQLSVIDCVLCVNRWSGQVILGSYKAQSHTFKDKDEGQDRKQFKHIIKFMENKARFHF